MITGVHTMFYSSKAAETRAFLRDKLKFPFKDVGDGWLIFDMPSADMGVHPTEAQHTPPSGTHAISFCCDDIQRTMTELKSRGVEFTQDVVNQGYGLVTFIKVPGDMEVQLYQPLYRK
ncbi:MAG: VOC family protein [Tepidisphaeraceae bacterium]